MLTLNINAGKCCNGWEEVFVSSDAEFRIRDIDPGGVKQSSSNSQ